MPIIAHAYDHVVGVDTHARTHTFAIIDTRTTAVMDTAVFPTSSNGIARAIAWIRRRTTGPVFSAVEGTSSYGAKLTTALLDAGIPVAEARPQPRIKQVTGKSDRIDAEAAARSVLGQDQTRIATPRAAGDRAALRVLLAARKLMDQQRTANRNALTALLRTADLGLDVRKPITDAQVIAVAAWRTSGTTDTALTVARREARRLARAVVDLTALLEQNHAELRRLTERTAPGLQDVAGVGPVTAAIIVCAYSHPGRVRSEAAFAALGGVAPLQASSGNSTRHRLNRAGDRQLNRAFDIIVRTRMTFDPNTRDYVERHRARGKTNREIRRILKRYVCRAIYRHVNTIMT